MSTSSTNINVQGTVVLNRTKRDQQAGFGFTLIAVVIALVMGLTVSLFFRQISTESAEMADMYAASQAHWSAMSGMEYGLFKAEQGEADISGTYTFHNSTILIDTLETSTEGGSLPYFWYMITSQGSIASSERNFRLYSKKSMKTVWGDVSIIEGTNDIDIRTSFTLDDSVYIGQEVDVQSDANIGNTTHTNFYVPDVYAVDPATGSNYTSGQHPRNWLFAPDFDTEPYDSLITLAGAISSDDAPNGEWDGNQRFRNEVMDLNDYPDSTIYCNGKFTFQACTITGGDTTRPAVIVAATTIIAENRSGVETTFGDNIVLIAGDDVKLQDATEFGLDHSALAPESRPRTFNLIYGYDLILITKNVVAWSSTFSTDDIRLEGAAYGITYAPDKFTFNKATSYMEGAIFANKIVGSNGANNINRGTMKLNHYFNQDFFKTYDYGVIDNSLVEF